MAQITITIPDDKVARIRDAFASEFAWSSDLGITKTEFTRQHLIRYIKQVVKNNESNSQSNQVRAIIDSDVESITIS